MSVVLIRFKLLASHVEDLLTAPYRRQDVSAACDARKVSGTAPTICAILAASYHQRGHVCLISGLHLCDLLASARRSTGVLRNVAVANTRRRFRFSSWCWRSAPDVRGVHRLQTMEQFLACHEHGFAAFGGVPSKIMVDNLKSAVLHRLAGAAPVFNPRYLDLPPPRLCDRGLQCRSRNEKGRVERGVGYVKKNFLQVSS